MPASKKTAKTNNTMRVTIKNHNQEFVNQIAQEMGCDAAEAVNYLLIELRKSGYSFNTPGGIQTQAIQPQKAPVTASNKSYDDVCQDASCFEYKIEQTVTAPAIDPVIEKFLMLGLDEF